MAIAAKVRYRGLGSAFGPISWNLILSFFLVAGLNRKTTPKTQNKSPCKIEEQTIRE
jgi:hypothetical protein